MNTDKKEFVFSGDWINMGPPLRGILDAYPIDVLIVDPRDYSLLLMNAAASSRLHTVSLSAASGAGQAYFSVFPGLIDLYRHHIPAAMPLVFELSDVNGRLFSVTVNRIPWQG